MKRKHESSTSTNARPARVLIAGCGYLGTALGLHLAAQGHTVFALRRRSEGLPAPLQPLAADLAAPASLEGLPGDLDFVFYTAAADRRDAGAYRAAYVSGVEHLTRAVVPARRFFLISSTAVWAQSDGGWVDEDSPAEPGSFAGRLLLEGEARLRASGLPASVVRFGGIYGPGRTRLVERARAGAVVPRGATRWTNRIHLDDGAALLAHLMRLDEPAPLYAAVDCEPAELRDVYAWLAARLGAPPPREGDAADDARGGEGNKRVSNARLLASGYRFRYPTFREGYAALL